MLAQSPLRYRRQVLALKQFFSGRRTTVLLLDDLTAPGEDQQLQSIAHGVIRLDQLATEYGAERRQLRVLKMRGVPFRGGLHDYVIRRGGLDVFPRLVAAEHTAALVEEDNSSGLPALDTLLGGGLPKGSSALLVGPAGCGKTTVALQFCLAAAERGERSALFLFDETVGMLLTRCRRQGRPLEPYVEAGLLSLQQIEPSELSPGDREPSTERQRENLSFALATRAVEALEDLALNVAAIRQRLERTDSHTAGARSESQERGPDGADATGQ